jgi:LIM domain kinase 1
LSIGEVPPSHRDPNFDPLLGRDIKTTNILVDKDWRAKICDFSFSCHVNSLLKQEFVYGTDEFMSPEIAMGEDFGLPSGCS